MEENKSTKSKTETAKLSDNNNVIQRLSFAFFAIQTFALIASGISICGLKEQSEPFAAIAMLLCSLYLCAFAREKSTVGYLIIPAYLIVLFTGNTSIPAFIVGICTFIGAGAFLKCAKPIAFIISAALTVGAAMLAGGIKFAAILIVLIPIAFMLAKIYPRYSLPRTVGIISLTLGISSIICLAFLLYTNQFPGIVGTANIISELKDIVITMISEKIKASGNSVGTAAIRQTVDEIFIDLPGILAITVEIHAFLSIAVCGAIFRNFGIEPKAFTLSEQRYIVSPITGMVFFVSAAIGPYSFSDSIGLASAVANNIFLAVLIPLAVFAVRITSNALKKKGKTLAGKIAVILMIFSALLSGINGIAALSAAGAVISIAIPIRYYTKKSENK